MESRLVGRTVPRSVVKCKGMASLAVCLRYGLSGLEASKGGRRRPGRSSGSCGRGAPEAFAELTWGQGVAGSGIAKDQLS